MDLGQSGMEKLSKIYRGSGFGVFDEGQPLLQGHRGCPSTLGRLSSFLSPTPSNHFRAGNVASFVDKIEISFLFLDADLGHLFGVAAFAIAAGHFGAGDIPSFVDKVKIPFLLFDTNFGYFCCHGVTPFLLGSDFKAF